MQSREVSVRINHHSKAEIKCDSRPFFIFYYADRGELILD